MYNLSSSVTIVADNVVIKFDFSGSYRFSQCDNDDSVYTIFTKDKEPQKDDGANLIWYKLSGDLTYWTYDG